MATQTTMNFNGVKKAPGMTAHFKCNAEGNGVACSPDRARWSNGFWADVCIRHHETWIGNMGKMNRSLWTGRLKIKTEA